MKQRILKSTVALFFCSIVFLSCKKENPEINNSIPGDESAALKSEGEQSIQRQQEEVAVFNNAYADYLVSANGRSNENIVETALRFPFFKALVAAVVKTGLAPTLSSASLNATVFAPTDAAFAQLPAPFNNANNIAAISDPAQIEALKTILLYHVLGSEVKRNDIANGRSSAVSLKAAGMSNDNTVYISKQYGLISLNGSSLILLTDVDASNGVVHVINKVLKFPTQNIAEIAIGDPAFSALVAGLVKTNLAGVFAGSGDFSVFAPTDAAFAQLPAPFNTAANINAISSQAEIDALSNILRYHVIGSRYFTIDLGFFNRPATLADAPNNKVTTIPGFNSGAVKGNANPAFSIINPANILATNGVVQVINRVLLPQ